MKAITGAKAAQKARLRSLDDLDRRTTAAKAALELRSAIVADLGGEDRISAMKRELIESVALIGAALKDAAVRYIKGEPVDIGEFATLANTQRRLLADLGLERQAKEVQHLNSYLKGAK